MSEPRANCGADPSRRSLAMAVPIEQIPPSRQRLFADMPVSHVAAQLACASRASDDSRRHRLPHRRIHCASIALAITSCDHTATRSRLTSKSHFFLLLVELLECVAQLQSPGPECRRAVIMQPAREPSLSIWHTCSVRLGANATIKRPITCGTTIAVPTISGTAYQATTAPRGNAPSNRGIHSRSQRIGTPDMFPARFRRSKGCAGLGSSGRHFLCQDFLTQRPENRTRLPRCGSPIRISLDGDQSSFAATCSWVRLTRAAAAPGAPAPRTPGADVGAGGHELGRRSMPGPGGKTPWFRYSILTNIK